jgi:hypothetical protein
VCGIFSHPADRYQSRLIPITPLAVIVIAIATRRRDKASAAAAC